MKYVRDDKVKLKKEFDHLPSGLQGKVLQVQGRELLIGFQANFEVYYFTESQVEEYLELVW